MERSLLQTRRQEPQERSLALRLGFVSIIFSKALSPLQNGNIHVTTLHKINSVRFPTGTGPKEPLQVGGQTVMAPKGSTVVTGNNGQQVIRVPMGPRAFPNCE